MIYLDPDNVFNSLRLYRNKRHESQVSEATPTLMFSLRVWVHKRSRL